GLGLGLKLSTCGGDFGECRQARLVAEMLDLVGGRRSREMEMLIPALHRVGKVGIDVCAVENVSSAACINDALRRYGKRGQFSDVACLVIPNETSLSERHPANATAAALEIIQHRRWFLTHLLAQAFFHDRHVDVGQEFVGIRPKSPTIERGKNPRSSAEPGVIDRGVRLVSVQMKRTATREVQDGEG